jgi:hypothetical protein
VIACPHADAKPLKQDSRSTVQPDPVGERRRDVVRPVVKMMQANDGGWSTLTI